MTESSDDPLTVNRREARSGRVSFSDPITLYESSRQRILLVPFFVKRSDGTKLALKIQTLVRGEPPLPWVERVEKSISLPHTAALHLLKGLRTYLRVAEEDDGGYIVIPVGDGPARLGHHAPESIALALTRVLSQEEILEQLVGLDLSDELVRTFQGSIKLRQMRAAIDRLRQLLEGGSVDERLYQSWCDEHSWVFGSAYLVRDDVKAISAGDKLDIILPTAFSGFRDFVELKRPDMRVLLWDKDHRNHYFSQDVSRAVGQCHRYIDVFHDFAQRGLRDHPEVVAYHPRATIIIGRSHDWNEAQHRALHGLNRRLAGVTIMTYDHLLAQGQRVVDALHDGADARRDRMPDWLEEEGLCAGQAIDQAEDDDFAF